MFFLSVLCVVLYFRSGDFLQIQNNAIQSRYQNQETDNLNPQRNLGIFSLSNGYNYVPGSQIHPGFVRHLNSQENLRSGTPQISPEYINSQQFKYINGQPLNERENIEIRNEYLKGRSAYVNPQEKHSVYVNPEVKNNNEAQQTPGELYSGPQLQTQGSLKYVPQPLYEEPAQHALDINSEVQSALTYPKHVNKQSISYGNIGSVISNEDTKLELQGISSELIQSIVNQNNMKSKSFDSVNPPVSLPKSYENVRHIEKPFNNNEYSFDQNRVKFVNPSAEVLYNMKQALPYNIQSQQLPKNSQGEVTFRNSVPNTKRVEDILRSTPPQVKRFMIIHPDGRVEHADDIEKLTKLRLNYTMISSQDMLKYLNDKATLPGLKILQPKQSIPVNNYQRISRINQEYNPVQDFTAEQQINKMLPSQTLNNIAPEKDSVIELSVTSSKTNVIPSKIPSAVDVTSNKFLNLRNKSSEQEINVVSNIAQKGGDFKGEVTIIHSLPIIKTQEIQSIQTPSDISTGSFPIQNQQQTLSTTSNRYETVEKSLTPLTSAVSTTTEISEEIKNQTQAEKTNVVISENTTTQPQNDEEIYTSEETSEYDSSNSPSEMSDSLNLRAYDSSESIIHDIKPVIQPDNNTAINITSVNIPVLHISHETLQFINNNDSTTTEPTTTNKTPVSSVHLLKKTEVPTNEQVNNNINITSSESGISSSDGSDDVNKPSHLANTTNTGGFWFQADDRFWENITNNNDAKNLFYFLFVPPKPSIVEKETKTTIYANGTTVEEISETRDEDGVPTVVRHTKVSYANSTSTDV